MLCHSAKSSAGYRSLLALGFASPWLAAKAGFAGVELHGANGYLLTQFISTTTNLRTDEYGGTLTGRAKLIVDIVHACRERVSKNFIIGVRLSPVGDGLDIDETIQIAKWLSEAGADFIDLSLGDVMTPLPNAQQAKEPLVSYVRKALGDEITLISGGGIHTPQQAEAALKLGVDCITLGRIAIGNPSWPQLAIDNAPEKIISLPYDRAYLQQTVSEAFLDYIENQLPLAITQSIVR